MHLTPLLHAGYLGKLTNPRTLQHVADLADAQAAQLLFVSKQTYRRWGADRPANLTAMRLLAICAGIRSKAWAARGNFSLEVMALKL